MSGSRTPLAWETQPFNETRLAESRPEVLLRRGPGAKRATYSYHLLMQGLDVENKDWVSRRIPSTVNLLLLVSQGKCAHFGRQWKLKVTCGKTQVLKLFLHGRCWKPVSVQKAAIMTWSFANCRRQGLPGEKKGKNTNTFRNETLTFILAEKDGFFPRLSLRADLWEFLDFDCFTHPTWEFWSKCCKWSCGCVCTLNENCSILLCVTMQISLKGIFNPP